jgi:YHS domain-containing protein
MRNASLKGMGSTEVAAFKAAQQVAAPEVARILTNPNLAGQLTDSARHEAEQVLSGDYSFNQLVAVANTLKQDFANRKTSYAEQINEIKGRMTPNQQAPGQIPVRAGGKVYYFPTQEKADTFKKRAGIK